MHMLLKTIKKSILVTVSMLPQCRKCSLNVSSIFFSAKLQFFFQYFCTTLVINMLLGFSNLTNLLISVLLLIF